MNEETFKVLVSLELRKAIARSIAMAVSADFYAERFGFEPVDPEKLEGLCVLMAEKRGWTPEQTRQIAQTDDLALLTPPEWNSRAPKIPVSKLVQGALQELIGSSPAPAESSPRASRSLPKA